MKPCKALSVVALVVLGSAIVLAQDPVRVASSHYKSLFENADVRILQVDYAAGSKSAMHQHPDSMVISLTPSRVRFGTADGKSQDSDMPSDSGMYTPAGTHSSANIGTTSVKAVLVEFKTAAPGTGALPASRPGMTMKVLAEGPRATAYRMTADPTFHEAAGSKHDYDQVVIALAPSKMSLTLDGKPAKTNWTRGDVQFIGRGVAHESQNMGGKPIDYVIIAIR
ncbi:MAG: beta-alanine degradation protein BauB [Acidobacteriota bacterium]|jgi:quercetin dioxygenase-like cupin family protein